MASCQALRPGRGLTGCSSDVEKGVHAGVEVVGGAALHQPGARLVQHRVLLVHAPRDELQRLLALVLREAHPTSTPCSAKIAEHLLVPQLGTLRAQQLLQSPPCLATSTDTTAAQNGCGVTAGKASVRRQRTLSTKVVEAMLGPCRSSSVPSVKMWKRARWP